MMPDAPKRILLVEDDAAGAELTLAALSLVDPALAVDVVGDGEEALDYLSRAAATPPAAIVLDLKMPKVDGHEVLRQVRATPGLEAIRVIVLTSSDRESDRAASAALGSDRHLVKPAGMDELVAQFADCAHLFR